jgi:hypothetical protein
MNNARITTRFFVTAIAFAVLAAGVWAILSRRSKPAPPETERTQPNQHAITLAQGTADRIMPEEVLIAARSLGQSGRAEDSLLCLAQLRNQLNGLGTEAASRAVQRYFDSGADSPTHLGFKLARDGSLSSAPSLRLFLLDYLTKVDPKAAAAYAEKILRSSDSPDEWAISLRAYALANTTPDGKTYLQQKLREMLRNESWQRNPSVGFLEAFDVIVHTRDREMTPDLANWARQTDNRALSHAAFLTLDRLIQKDPVEMLSQLQSQPDLLSGREAMRADLFARTDVRDAQQRQILESYLLDPNRSETEWKQFAAVYPNANQLVSYNLLTQSPTPTGEGIGARDREALRVAQEWLDDPRFARLRPQLQTLKSRLDEIIKLSER